MNFKTTIVLVIVLIVVGGIALFTGHKNTAEQSDQPVAVNDSTTGQKLLDVESGQVSMLLIVDAQGNRTGVQKVNGKWRMTEPISSVGSQVPIEQMIASIVSIESKGRPSSTPDSQTGLNNPSYKISLSLDDGRTVRLSLGKKNSVGDMMYASVDGGDVNLIDPAITKDFDTVSDDLRDKHLLGLKVEEVKQFHITFDKQTLWGSYFQNKWMLREPNGEIVPGDKQAIEAMLSAFNKIVVTRFVKSDSDELQFAHFDHPTAKFWMTGTAETDAAFPTTMPTTEKASATTEMSFRRDELSLAVGAADSLSRENYFVRTSDGVAATVPVSDLDKFKQNALDLRDRTIIRILMSQVRSISIQKQNFPKMQPATRGGPIASPMIVTTQQVSLLWQPPKALPATRPTTRAMTMPSEMAAAPQPTWILATDPNAKIDPQKIDDLLGQFDPLRAQKYLEKRPAVATQVHYVVELGLADGTMQKLEFTRPADDSNPYSIRDGLIFEVSPALTNALDSDFRAGGK